MGELRLWAIDVETVRQLTPASPMLAGRLRSIAAQNFRVPEVEGRSVGLLSKLGPLVRTPHHAPRLPPGMPSHNDVEHLVAGRFVTPDQLPKAWTILTVWLDDLAWGSARISIDNLDETELDLARAGLPAEYGIRRLLSRDAELRVRPLPGTKIGHATHEHVCATADQLAAVVDTVEHRSSVVAGQVFDHLRRYRGWAAEARAVGRPDPDLFAVLS